MLTYPQGIETQKTYFYHYLTDGLFSRDDKTEDVAKLWGGNRIRILKAVAG